ncbi:flagellar biosynthesis anti-sigma factor FlgM [Clostridium sp.]|uniref:flagellar biosynthesis anti-sigma factor FlgM n=1 Tax=Clostridium sp. TaxID=1506 RepID=UPI003216EB37
MKINNGNIHALYVKNYKTNENISNKDNCKLAKENIKDTCELSSLGKSLNKLSIEDESIGVSNKVVEKIRNEISKGTYTVDSKVLAKAMVNSMKGGQ